MRRYNIRVGQNEYVIDVQEMAADRFRVWIEDHELDVCIADDQDIAEATITPGIVPSRAEGEPIERPRIVYRPPAAETMPPLPASQQPALPQTQITVSGQEAMLTAPMPGTVLSINVAPGDKVAHGQVLLILEAMKMKNSIKSPHDGTIAEIMAQPGQSVGYGSVLLRFENSCQ